MNDPRDHLSDTLRAWSHEPTPAPDFNDRVWARIQSAEVSSSTKPDNLFHFHLALPLAASVAVILSIAAGSGGAFALSRLRTTDLMAAAYVRSIDPVQMTAGSDAHTHTHP